MKQALVNADLLVGRSIVADQALLLDDDRIAGVVGSGALPDDALIVDCSGLLIAPGFIDTQVNGGSGKLFNDDPSVETIATIGAAHRRFGTTGFLPTLISDELSVVRAGIAAVDAAIEAGIPGVLGIHIEGPFLNVERKGIHDPARMRTLDDEGFVAVTGLRRGKTLVTLAPERTTPAMIARLVDAGIIVAAGHTNATYEQMQAAADAGLSGVTHLFNAMSPMTSRRPGTVGAALSDERLCCGLIADGAHVHPATMRAVWNAKGTDQIMLVTDAMPTVGAASKTFVLQGQTITERDGVCYGADGTLAGSGIDMAGAVAKAEALIGVTRIDALRMASQSPAAFLGLASLGSIAVGKLANLVALSPSGEVKLSWISGRLS